METYSISRNSSIQKYTFEVSDVKMLFTLFNMYEEEANKAMNQNLVFPAYDYVLKCSHTFNLLDARGAISVTEEQDTLCACETWLVRLRHVFGRAREAGLPAD